MSPRVHTPASPAPRRRPGPKPGEGGRPRAPAAKVREALALVEAEGLTAEEAAERVGLGGNTVRRAMRDPSRAAPTVPPPAPEAPATANDRKVDELVSQSRTWRRVCEALGRFAARHPEVAADLAAELRSLDL